MTGNKPTTKTKAPKISDSTAIASNIHFLTFGFMPSFPPLQLFPSLTFLHIDVQSSKLAVRFFSHYASTPSVTDKTATKHYPPLNH